MDRTRWIAPSHAGPDMDGEPHPDRPRPSDHGDPRPPSEPRHDVRRERVRQLLQSALDRVLALKAVPDDEHQLIAAILMDALDEAHRPCACERPHPRIIP